MSKKHILVVGERCEDSFIEGRCPRLSPEAPVVVFQPIKQSTNPGMAANVVANLNSLAPEWEVDFFSQPEAVHKVRLVDEASQQQIVRVDMGDDKVGRLVFETLFNLIKQRGEQSVNYDAIVFSEYKGFAQPEDIAAIAAWAKEREIPVFCDTKHLIDEWAKDVTVIKINRKEADAHGEEPWPYSEYIIVTEGPKGCYLHARKEPGVLHRVPVKKIDLKQVAGAGDSFLAGLVVSYLEQEESDQQARLIKAMAFANKVAAVAVSKPGVVAVRREEVV